MKTRRISELSLLTAIALSIFVLETQLPAPLPIPGVKLGLSNIVTVYAVYRYRAREVALMLIARILLGAIFSGRLTALMYSLCGGALCLLGMLALRRAIPEDNLWFSSVIGAALHNIGQLAVAAALTGTAAVFAYLPILLLSACLSGAFTGLCAQYAARRLQSLQSRR